MNINKKLLDICILLLSGLGSLYKRINKEKLISRINIKNKNLCIYLQSIPYNIVLGRYVFIYQDYTDKRNLLDSICYQKFLLKKVKKY